MPKSASMLAQRRPHGQMVASMLAQQTHRRRGGLLFHFSVNLREDGVPCLSVLLAGVGPLDELLEAYTLFGRADHDLVSFELEASIDQSTIV